MGSPYTWGNSIESETTYKEGWSTSFLQATNTKQFREDNDR